MTDSLNIDIENYQAKQEEAYKVNQEREQWIEYYAKDSLLNLHDMREILAEWADDRFIVALQEWLLDAKESNPKPKLYLEVLRMAKERLEFQAR